jgi:hypothetical protein
MHLTRTSRADLLVTVLLAGATVTCAWFGPVAAAEDDAAARATTRPGKPGRGR